MRQQSGRIACRVLTITFVTLAAARAGMVETRSNPVAAGRITVDGSFGDWAGLLPYSADAAGDVREQDQDWVQVWIAHDNDMLYLQVQRAPGSASFSSGMVTGGSTGGVGYWIVLDTDSNRATGLKAASGRMFSIGGEFNFGGTLALNGWSPGGAFTGPRDYARVEAGTRLEIGVPLATLGNPAALSCILVGETSADYYPNGGASADWFEYVIREPAPTGEIAVRSNPVANGVITLDGQTGDWAGVTPFPPDAGGDGGTLQDWVQAWAAHDDHNIYFRVQRAPGSLAFASAHGYWVLLDTDLNPGTGLTTAGARTFSIGAEYNLSPMEFNAWAASGCNLSSTAATRAISPDGLMIELAAPLQAMRWPREFRLVFAGENSGDYYPEGGQGTSWFRYSTMTCASPFADAEGDTDVDQDDFGAFQRCLGAGEDEPLPADCRCFDRNADNAVDLADFARFQVCVSGPGIKADPACEQRATESDGFFPRFVELPDAPGPLPYPLLPGEHPGFSIRGTKGWNWTPSQYLDVVPYLAQYRMNFLMNCYLSIFAVQGGNNWWVPLPADAKAAYQQVINACNASGVNFCFCMNPQLSSSRPLDPMSDADLEQLWQHYAWAQSAGVRWFCVALDDISGVPIVGTQHARLVNRLLARLRVADPQAQMVFCPTWYWGDGSTGHDYLAALAADLETSVYVFWTGDAVVTPRITKAAAASYKAVVQHRLVLWDNYPVNDGSQTMHLGPAIGRDPQLGQVLDGYMSNPLYPQDQANRIPMLTCADYAYNPGGYDPYRSIGQSIVHLAPIAAGQAALQDLVEAYPGMVGFECGSFGTGYNPVRAKYLRLATSLAEAGALIAYLQNLSTRLAQAFPDQFEDARTVLNADIGWMSADHAARGGS